MAPSPPKPDPTPEPGQRQPDSFERDLIQLKRRLVREATTAIEMIESAMRALKSLDTDLAVEVRRDEEHVDIEEVAIETECLRLMTLRQPFGADFRMLTFCLKVNGDLERVADHASGIAKITRKIAADGSHPAWPTAMLELGERVPVLCHRLVRAVLDENEDAARELVHSDKVIDALDKRLFEEVTALIDSRGCDARTGLMIYRIGRSLERVGDLMANIAEDVVYLTTGEIIRHTKKKQADGAG